MYDLKKLMKCKLCYSSIFLIEIKETWTILKYFKKLFLLHENRKIVHGICDGKFDLKIRFFYIMKSYRATRNACGFCGFLSAKFNLVYCLLIISFLNFELFVSGALFNNNRTVHLIKLNRVI